MEYYYHEAVYDDIKDYIKDEVTLSDYENKDEAYEQLYDDLWVADSVTGNASGSYTCNAWYAEEYLAHNWDILEEALAEFGYTEGVSVIEKGAEWCDVTIRCYLLGQVLGEVLEELFED